MKNLLPLLLLLLTQSSYADLYKCNLGNETTYQDKPCEKSQTQRVIAQKNFPAPQVTALVVENSAVIERDAHGRIKCSEKAKADFKAANPCPANHKRAGACPGYVIDHINPLACGGADSSENMQWQTVADGKAKDGWERDDCKHIKSPALDANVFVPNQQESIPANTKTQTVYIGKRGGHYVLSKSGRKRYLGRK